MLDQAFSPEQLSDPTIQELRAEVEKTGSRDAVCGLYFELHKKIGGSNATHLLMQNYLSTPGVRNRIYEEYNGKLISLKHAASDDDWLEFVDEVQQVAERLWRDKFLPIIPTPNPGEVALMTHSQSPAPSPLVAHQQGEDEAGDGVLISIYLPEQSMISNREMRKRMRGHTSGEYLALQLTCNVAKLLLVLWLDAKLYQYRADANRRSIELQPNQRQGARATRKAIGAAIQEPIANYKNILHAWNSELRAVTGSSLFIQRYADSQRFRTLGKEFVTSSSVNEAGWAAQSSEAYEEIRYQLFEELRRGSFFPVSLFYNFLRLSTGYGMKPVRFVWTAITTILTFTLLFFANDFFNPGIGSDAHFCSGATTSVTNWYDPFLIAFRYLYVAVTNLTTLGSNPQIASYCGGTSTQVLLIVATLTGYFLLALLAALFFKLLTEAV